MKRAYLVPAFGIALLSLSPGSAGAKDCAERLEIEASNLHFGTISIPTDGAGVVVVSVRGGVATLGRIAGGLDAQPGFLRICGPADTDFLLRLQAGDGDRADDVDLNDLEIETVRGVQLEPHSEGQWSGNTGGRGVVEVQIGGSLRIGQGMIDRSLVLPFRATVTASD